jgi:Cdc6-like AAA superfamily ATPase
LAGPPEKSLVIEERDSPQVILDKKLLSIRDALEAFQPTSDVPASSSTYSVEDAISGVFLELKDFEEILLLLETKKNIILQGPPGVGKTFIARRLAYALLEAEDEKRVKFVQFHQSFNRTRMRISSRGIDQVMAGLFCAGGFSVSSARQHLTILAETMYWSSTRSTAAT